MSRSTLTSAALAALVLAGLAGAALSRASDWEPTALVAVLALLAVAGEAFTVRFRGARLSGSFAALVLAMALLGPAPAAAIGLVSVLADDLFHRRALRDTVWNAATYVTIPLLGGLALRPFAGAEPIVLAAAVVLVFLAANLLNFASVAAYLQLSGAMRVRDAFLTVYRAMFPFELATALLTAGVAYSYVRVGLPAIPLLAVVLFVFHHLARTGIRAHDRGVELERRTDELGTLQVGVIATVMQTLSMRDPMTARHSGAVARYSREAARMLGLDEREQDLIHTAALLHDIGKFILPDSILFADRKLTDEEWELIKLHPESGAKLVQRIEGYGPIAEIVLHHHERFSGGGYPTGISGDQIPIGARIISVADTYDVMTSRDSYRRPVSSEAALAELRRVAGTQLDPVVVAAFERIILERRVAFSHTDAADFERELDARSIKRTDQPAETEGVLHSPRIARQRDAAGELTVRDTPVAVSTSGSRAVKARLPRSMT